MKLYVVYRHSDPEGLVYIGITRKLPRKRFDYGRGYKHNRRFNEAIERIGWDNFRHDILAEGLTREEAETLEAQYIAEYRSTDPAFGYNVKTGGTYGKGITEEARRRLPRKKALKPKEELSSLIENNTSDTVPVADIVESVCVSISDMTAKLKEAQMRINAEIEALRAQIEEKEKELERVERLLPSLVRCENEVRPI